MYHISTAEHFEEKSRCHTEAVVDVCWQWFTCVDKIREKLGEIKPNIKEKSNGSKTYLPMVRKAVHRTENNHSLL